MLDSKTDEKMRIGRPTMGFECAALTYLRIPTRSVSRPTRGRMWRVSPESDLHSGDALLERAVHRFVGRLLPLDPLGRKESRNEAGEIFAVGQARTAALWRKLEEVRACEKQRNVPDPCQA